MYVIVGAFDWIGYHIIEQLLSDGEKVVGVDKLDSELKTHFLLSIGRNANFTFMDESSETYHKIQQQSVEHILLINRSDQNYINLTKKVDVYSLHTNVLTDRNDLVTYIRMPLVYGVWMPRDSSFLRWDKEVISFNSELFKKSAVAIEDFIFTVFQIIGASLKPNVIQVCMKKNETNQHDISNLYMIEQRNFKNKLTELESHYQQFKQLYEHHNI